jgi:hypothetical protein
MFTPQIKGHLESFVVLLRAFSTSAVTDTALLSKPQELKGVIDLFNEQTSQGLGSDRVSKRFPSGKSVTVAVRPKGVPGKTYSSWERVYDVDVAIYGDGRLPWSALPQEKSATPE